MGDTFSSFAALWLVFMSPYAGMHFKTWEAAIYMVALAIFMRVFSQRSAGTIVNEWKRADLAEFARIIKEETEGLASGETVGSGKTED